MKLCDRLKIARELLVKSQKDMATLLGIGYRSWQGYESGSNYPGGEVFESLARLGINTNWLLTGEGPMRRGEGTERDRGGPLAVTADLGPGFIQVPRYDIAASAGGGSVVHCEQVVDYLAFRAEWVQDNLRVDPRYLALIRVTGDSMEPTMSDGDLVLVDTSQRRIATDSIYVLQFLDGLLVKRVRSHADGTVSIISDNKIYEPETVRGEMLKGLNVIGRVVWYGRRA